jgi:hypothetical protein
MSNISLFRKNDIILVLVLLLLAATGLFAFKIFNSGEGRTVRVTIDGELFGEYPLGKEGSTGDDGYDAIIDDINMQGADAATGKDRSNINDAGQYQMIKIPGKVGECILIIKDGEAYMQEADCPNQICVHHSPVSHKGETIVCLPNRVIIEIR